YIINILIFSFFCLLFSSCATCSNGSRFYREAYHEARRGNYDVAFLNLRTLMVSYPDSPYAPMAAFSSGEYFLEKRDYTDAILTFYKYIKKYPDDDGRIFAELIIYKITNEIKIDKIIQLKERDIINDIKKKIFAKPMFFLFFDTEKSFSYRSLFGNVYTAYDYVDKVEIKRNGKVFLEISP
ncbi:MAG: outer membrane protein assembly factor BamD, partial [Promethearchaeota archaeon]